MSGHSKFANIKHKKEKNDAAKRFLQKSDVSLRSPLKREAARIRPITADCVM